MLIFLIILRYGKHIKVLNLLCQEQNYLNKKSECDLSCLYSKQLRYNIRSHLPTTENFEVDLKNLMQVNKESLYEVLADIQRKISKNISLFALNYMKEPRRRSTEKTTYSSEQVNFSSENILSHLKLNCSDNSNTLKSQKKSEKCSCNSQQFTSDIKNPFVDSFNMSIDPQHKEEIKEEKKSRISKVASHEIIHKHGLAMSQGNMNQSYEKLNFSNLKIIEESQINESSNEGNLCIIFL